MADIGLLSTTVLYKGSFTIPVRDALLKTNVAEDITYTSVDTAGRFTGSNIQNKITFLGNKPTMSISGSTFKDPMLILGNYDMTPRGTVSGTVSINSLGPVERLLRLYHRDTGKLLSETRSSAEGNYKFETHLSLDTPYYILCFNENSEDFNTLVQDWIVPDEE